jgi:hypothetical protein
VLPRYLLGRPLDSLDAALPNRLPWAFLNWAMGKLARAGRGGDPAAYGLRAPAHRILEQIPVVSSDLLPALRSGGITVRPGIEKIDGARLTFTDGTEEMVDFILCATGYRIALPFLSSPLQPSGVDVPLYRRIVAPDVEGLYFIGLVDAPSGLLPIVELQSAWLADALEERIVLPQREAMWAAIDAAERRTRERFPLEPPHSIRCDPHAYVRLLRRDRARAASVHGRRAWRRERLRDSSVPLFPSGGAFSIPSSCPLDRMTVPRKS